MDDDLEWLREHMRNHLANSTPIELSTGVLAFRSAAASSATLDSDVALELVSQAAEVVKGIEDRANEIESYARNIAERAAERLWIAEQRIQELEAERRAAEVCISEAHAKIERAEQALQLERARVKAAEDQLGQIVLRPRTAEVPIGVGAITFAKRVCQKITDMAARVQLNGVHDTASSGDSDHGRRGLGWTEILARADAALNSATGTGCKPPVYRKGHLTLRQVA
jgi:hypothetical protein